MPRIVAILALMPIALAACASSPRPTLDPVGDAIPPGVSLAGRWQLRTGADDAEATIRNSGYRSSGGLGDVTAPTRRDRGRPRDVAEGPSVFVFLRTGSKLKITQTPDGLFISFDRSVVEEYRFREHRIVNVGPIEADRASGWFDGKYVIRTLDAEGALLEESYQLQGDGDALLRSFAIVYEDRQILSVQQVYVRVE